LGLIKASKEVNNLIQPPKDLGVFLTVLEVVGDSFAGCSIEDSSEEFEGVHGQFKDPKIQGAPNSRGT
jgi:hypothetical protein